MKRHCLLLNHPVENEDRCRECDGECCRSFPALEITWAEFERLKALGSNRLYFSLTGHHKLIIENGCEFLSQGKCSIYHSRPDVCRRFICQEE
ncbi:MAG: YkgJ family cysteine cluster protein [Thermodesulfobacteriota bacterium]